VGKGGVEKASGTATRRGSEGADADADAKTGLAGSTMTSDEDLHMQGYKQGFQEAEAGQRTPDAYRQQIAMDVFCSLVHGVRIQVQGGAEPSAVAERILKLHSELMLKAEQAGIIPPAGEKAAS
jgi:hypothetical protein